MNRISDEELIERLRKGLGYVEDEDCQLAADRLSALSPRVKVKAPASLSMKDGVVMAAFNTDEEAQEFFDALSAIEVSASPRVVTDEYERGLRRAAEIAMEENQRRLALASIRIPAMAEEIRDAILAEAAALSSAGEKEGEPPTSAEAKARLAEIVAKNPEDFGPGTNPLEDTGADKLEVVAWRGRVGSMPWELALIDPTPYAVFDVVEPLVRQSDATRIITEQAEKIDRLRDEYTLVGQAYDAMRARAEAAEADRDRMKDALRFYANGFVPPTGRDRFYEPTHSLLADCGQRARAALNGGEG